MRTKVTLVLLLLNVALLAVIIYARREWRHEQDLAKLSKRVFGNEALRAKTIEIASPGSDRKIRLERPAENAPWEIKAPINWPANDFAVRAILHELEFLEPLSSFPVTSLEENGQTLAEYGLNPPQLTLALTHPDANAPSGEVTTRLQIGDAAKIGNRLYILSPDGQTVHVVRRGLADKLIVGMEELRTDTLFTIPVFEVRSLGLQNAAPAPRVRLRKEGSRWSFEAPIATRAAKAQAEIVVSGLNNLRALDFLNDLTLADAGVDKPSLRVTLEGNSRRETLLVGNPFPLDPSVAKPANATLFYAGMEGRPQVFVTSIPDDLLEKLRQAQEKLREPRVLDFDPATVASISLSAPGRPEPLVIRREDGATNSWRIVRAAGQAPLPADPKLVEHLLQRLSLLTATSFLRDAPSAAEVENYGFNLPQREITLAFADAATPVTLQLGVSSANGGTVQARVVGQPFIYAVAPDTLNEIPVVSNAYRERTLPFLPQGAAVGALSLVASDAPDQPVFSLKPAEGQSLEDALATESEPRRDALRALLAGLSPLRAKAFVRDTFTETTLVDGKPTPWKYALTATYTSAGASAPAEAVLKIAERSGGGAQLAGSKDLDVVFALEQPLVDALWTLTYSQRDPGPPAPAASP